MSKLNDHTSRDHALLSASSAHRWLACPPSAVAAELYPAQDTEYTREGTLAHEVAELFARVQVIDSHPDQTVVPASCTSDEEAVTAEMQECAKGYADYIQEQTRTPDALILLEQRVDFSPWVPDGFGTADCIIIQGDTMDVIDYKYGVGVPVSAIDNPQMKLYGLGALNDYGFACDIKTVRLHIFQPRINNISVDEISAADLQKWAEKTVKPTAKKAIDGKGDYKEGSHCTFCPHAGKCRQLMLACLECVNVMGIGLTVPVLAPHEVADALQKAPLIKLWLKRIKQQALTDLLDGKEIPGYKVVEVKLGNRKWRDELQVAEALKAAGYQLGDITETKLLSPAGMDKSIGKAKVAELLTDLIDRAPGAPTVVPETDKRAAYDRTKDFEILDK